MHDQRRTKAQLCEELAALRARVAELEQARVAPLYAGEQIAQRQPGADRGLPGLERALDGIGTHAIFSG